MSTDSDDRGDADPLSDILTDTETFLGRWLDRFEGLLTHGERLAVWEQQLRGREQELSVAADELSARRRRWTESHEREVEILQQQVEELTQAWLRLEDEQRGLANTLPGQSPSANTSPSANASPALDASPSPEAYPSPAAFRSARESEGNGSSSAGPADVSDPETSLNPVTTSGVDDRTSTGGKPAATTPRRGQAATPAPIPVGLKSRDVSQAALPKPAAGDENGPPRKLSQATDLDESREGNRGGEPAPTPNLPRESRFEQFRQLRREVGLASRPRS